MFDLRSEGDINGCFYARADGLEVAVIFVEREEHLVDALKVNSGVFLSADKHLGVLESSIVEQGLL